MASFWIVAPSYRDTEVGQTLGSLDSVFALQGAYITSSPISCVIRVIIGEQAFFVKTYTRGGKNLKRWFGRSRARAEWENLLYFGRLEIPTAPLVAYGQDTLGGIFRRGALVTREVVNTQDLERLCASHHPRLSQRSWVLDVSRQLADHTRRLHRDGFGHLDLKLRNILVTIDATPQVYFIDCPAGCHRRGPMAARWFIKDLACLDRDARQWITRTQRLGFFLDYLGRPSLRPQDKKEIIRIQRFSNRRPPKKTTTISSDTAFQIPCYDAKTLRRAGHNLQPPFRIDCEHDGMVSPLICRDILRHLPGKRLVCLVDGDRQQTAIAKIYLDRRHAGRHLKRESRGLDALRTSSLASPEVLYHGRIGNGGKLLLLEVIRDVRRLDHYWADLASDQTRRQTLERVIVCIARLHAEGLRQQDIHPGNFLIADQKIWIIDGSAIQRRYLRKPLAMKPSLSNLALFWSQFDSAYISWVPQSLALYCRTRHWSRPPNLEEQLMAAITRQRIRRLKNRSRKMMRSSTAAIARKHWGHYMLCDRQWYRPDCERLLNNLDSYIQRGRVLKSGNSATVARIRFQGQDIVVKRYNLKNRLHFMRRCLRHSRALHSWCNAHVLRQLGIETPRPLAMIEERWGPLRRRAYYISDYQPGPSLATYWQADRMSKNPCLGPLRALADLFQKMADAHVCHGDCKASNMVVNGDRIALLDLDGVRIFRSPRAFRRRFDKDCQRFKRNWARHPLIHRKIESILSKLRMPAAT
jgi:tRNA A-37 threonylcarbamoyl transferase component Bud32